MNNMMRPYRWHVCAMEHRWHAPVIFASETVNLSGERRATCPQCGETARISEPWTVESGEPYPFSDMTFPFTTPDEWRR